jgi:hypothetical protein
MIIRRIQALEPTEGQTEGEKNNGQVEDSMYCETDSRGAQTKSERLEDQNSQENGSKQLRRIYPRSPSL